MTKTIKLTFAEMTSKIEAEKSNSDLQNLAHALLAIKATQQELETLKFNIENLAGRIESGFVVNVGEVRELYDKVREVSITI